MRNQLELSSYAATARSAQKLAEMLKRARPHLKEQVGELQVSVTRAHQKLHELRVLRELHQLRAPYGEITDSREGEQPVILFLPADLGEATLALGDLDEAYQLLLELRRRAKDKSLPTA